jgi:hypothetical protein
MARLRGERRSCFNYTVPERLASTAEGSRVSRALRYKVLHSIAASPGTADPTRRVRLDGLLVADAPLLTGTVIRDFL